MSAEQSDHLPVPVKLDADTIARDLARHNPDLSLADLQKIAIILIEEIQAAIKRGDRIGVIHQNQDGSIDISYLTVEPIKSTAKRLLMRAKRR